MFYNSVFPRSAYAVFPAFALIMAFPLPLDAGMKGGASRTHVSGGHFAGFHRPAMQAPRYQTQHYQAPRYQTPVYHSSVQHYSSAQPYAQPYYSPPVTYQPYARQSHYSAAQVVPAYTYRHAPAYTRIGGYHHPVSAKPYYAERQQGMKGKRYRAEGEYARDNRNLVPSTPGYTSYSDYQPYPAYSYSAQPYQQERYLYEPPLAAYYSQPYTTPVPVAAPKIIQVEVVEASGGERDLHGRRHRRHHHQMQYKPEVVHGTPAPSNPHSYAPKMSSNAPNVVRVRVLND